MKTLLLSLILYWLIGTSVAHAQKPFQFLLIGFDYAEDDQEVFFCGDQRLNEVATTILGINLFAQTDPDLLVDSVRSKEDLSRFSETFVVGPVDVGGVVIWSGPVYRPSQIGTDTVFLRAYYGPYNTTAQIICRARNLTDPLLYGFSRTTHSYGGSAIYLENIVLRDTLQDYMKFGPYRASSTPQPTGVNKAIVIRSCSGTRVEEVKMESDFSEFSFHNMPEPGQSIPDSFAITYDFIPSIVGKQIRPISFRLSDGRWLTWVFNYQVKEPLAVRSRDDAPGNVTVSCSNNRSIIVTSSVPVSLANIVDVTGITRKRAVIDNLHEFKLDLEGFPSGVYPLQSPSFERPVKIPLP